MVTDLMWCARPSEPSAQMVGTPEATLRGRVMFQLAGDPGIGPGVEREVRRSHSSRRKGGRRGRDRPAHSAWLGQGTLRVAILPA